MSSPLAPPPLPAETDPASDPMVAFALEGLLAETGTGAPLLPQMVARWPEAAPLEIAFALTSAAAAIEAMLTPEAPGTGAAACGYRLAALLAADLHAMQALHLPARRAADLTAWWQIEHGLGSSGAATTPALSPGA